MIILVTGANGMLGSAVVRLLRSADVAVIPHGGRVDGDLRDKSVVEQLFSHARHATAVVHCAADIGGVGAQLARDYYADNAVMGARVIETAARKGVKRFIFISSSTVYPSQLGMDAVASEEWPTAPESQYAPIAQVKLFLERFGRTLQFERGFCVLRPSAIYGPFDRGFRDVWNGHVIPGLIDRAARLNPYTRSKDGFEVWGDLDVERDFVYVDDVARAVVTALHDPRWTTVNVSEGASVTVGALARLVLDVFGKGEEWTPVPSKHNSHFGSAVKIRRVSSQIARGLGWSPHVGLEEGIRRTVAWTKGDIRWADPSAFR